MFFWTWKTLSDAGVMASTRKRTNCSSTQANLYPIVVTNPDQGSALSRELWPSLRIAERISTV